MARILAIHSSARQADSYSRQLTREFVEMLQQARGPHVVVERDLVRDPIPVLQEDLAIAIRQRPETLDDGQRALTVLSEQLIDEIKSADLVVLGTPMYNWSIPAALKAYLDQVMRIGKTFDYGAGGVVGLLQGKPIVVIMVRGGTYTTPDRIGMDFQQPYLARVLGVIGFAPTFVLAEGSLTGPANFDGNLAQARSSLREIAASGLGRA